MMGLMRPLLIAAISTVLAVNVLADPCPTPRGPRKFQSASADWRLVIEQQRATLSQQNKRKARWTLPNAPMTALVANDGTTIIVGECGEATGKNDIVIYRPDGTLVRRLPMSEMSGEHRVDEKNRQLVLAINGPQKAIPLTVSLETGALAQYEPVVSIGADRHDSLASRRCEGGIEVPGSGLLGHAIDLPLPEYPATAVKARIEGDVVLDVKVLQSGAVDAVTVIQPLPFGLDEAARDAARKWRFGPINRTSCGRFVAHFALRQLPPGQLD